MNPKLIDMLRDKYKPGTRVELVQMEDQQAPPVGTKGTVFGVDALGSVMVKWDNGSTLSVVYGVDRCKIIANEYWVFLEKLRRSGKTNMFGAAPYLMVEFGLDQKEAKEILIDWMKNYNSEDYK